jgi:hypothetical protein
MSEELRDQVDRLECMTVFGRVIDSDKEIKKYQFDETYPLRFHLRELSRFIWFGLLREGRQEKDVLHAVNVVKREIVDFDPDVGEEAGNDEETNAKLIEKLTAELKSLGAPETAPENIYAETGRPPLRSWCIYTDPTPILDCVEDDWLQNKELWRVEEDWTWAHIHDFLALLAIDSALLHAEQGEPFKAAVWVARATGFYAFAFDLRGQVDADAQRTRFAKQLASLAKNRATGMLVNKQRAADAHAQLRQLAWELYERNPAWGLKDVVQQIYNTAEQIQGRTYSAVTIRRVIKDVRQEWRRDFEARGKKAGLYTLDR